MSAASRAGFFQSPDCSPRSAVLRTFQARRAALRVPPTRAEPTTHLASMLYCHRRSKSVALQIQSEARLCRKGKRSGCLRQRLRRIRQTRLSNTVLATGVRPFACGVAANSGSPTQMRSVLVEKLKIDGVVWEELVDPGPGGDRLDAGCAFTQEAVAWFERQELSRRRAAQTRTLCFKGVHCAVISRPAQARTCSDAARGPKQKGSDRGPAPRGLGLREGG